MVLAIFLIATGLLFWVFPENSVLEYGFAEMSGFFSLTPFVFIFLVPAVTMRTFAEEKKAGTLEWLLTKPLSEGQILVGKFLASWALVLLALLPTLVYYFSLWILGSPQGNIDSAGVTGSYLGLVLLAGVFSSIGIFGSSLTDNQLVAFMVSVFLCFFLYSGLGSAASINVWSSASGLLAYLGLDYHYQALSKGLIDFRDVIYFISVLTLMLLSTLLVLHARLW